MFYVSQDAQSSVYSKWAAVHCSRWNLSTSVPWGVIHELQKSEQRDWYSDSESKRSSSWALLLRYENGSFQRSQIFQFLNRSFFRSSPVVMNLEQRWDFFEEIRVWRFVTKCTGLTRKSGHENEWMSMDTETFYLKNCLYFLAKSECCVQIIRYIETFFYFCWLTSRSYGQFAGMGN